MRIQVDNKKCFYCETKIYLAEELSLSNPGHYSPNKYSRDHVIPLSRGGRKKGVNVVPACMKCNGIKNNYLPNEFYAAIKRNGLYSNSMKPIVLANVEKLINAINKHPERYYKHYPFYPNEKPYVEPPKLYYGFDASLHKEPYENFHEPEPLHSKLKYCDMCKCNYHSLDGDCPQCRIRPTLLRK